MKKLSGLILCLVFLFVANTVNANSLESKKLFSKGVAEYNANNYQKALSLFYRSRDEGMKDVRLYYNMGSAHYRIQEYKEAYNAFKKSSLDASLAPTSRYSMGLAARKMNNFEQAIQDFLLSYQLSTTEREKSRAFRMLSKMNATDKITAKEKWQALLSAKYGYMGNAVATNPDNVISRDDVEDQYQQYLIRIGFRSRYNLKFNFESLLLNYNNIDSRDYANNTFNGIYRKTFSKWLINLNIGVSASHINGKIFQASNSVSFESQYLLSESAKLSLHYQWNNYYDLDNRYNYLNGNKNKITFKGAIRKYRNHFRIELGVENNTRKDYFVNNAFSESFSPTRYSITIFTSHKLNERFSFSSIFKFRKSRYHDANQLSDGTKKTRIDDFYQFNGQVHYLIRKRIWLFSEIAYNKNQSNITAYQYDSEQISVGIIYKY